MLRIVFGSTTRRFFKLKRSLASAPRLCFAVKDDKELEKEENDDLVEWFNCTVPDVKDSMTLSNEPHLDPKFDDEVDRMFDFQSDSGILSSNTVDEKVKMAFGSIKDDGMLQENEDFGHIPKYLRISSNLSERTSFGISDSKLTSSASSSSSSDNKNTLFSRSDAQGILSLTKMRSSIEKGEKEEDDYFSSFNLMKNQKPKFNNSHRISASSREIGSFGRFKDFSAFPKSKVKRAPLEFLPKVFLEEKRHKMREPRITEEFCLKTHMAYSQLQDIRKSITDTEMLMIDKLKGKYLKLLSEDFELNSKEGNVANKQFLSTLIKISTTMDDADIFIQNMNKFALVITERLPHLSAKEMAYAVLLMASCQYQNVPLIHEIWDQLRNTDMISNMDDECLCAIVLGCSIINMFNSHLIGMLELEFARRLDKSLLNETSTEALSCILFCCRRSNNKEWSQSLKAFLVDALTDKSKKAEIKDGGANWRDLGLLAYVAYDSRTYNKDIFPVIFNKLISKDFEGLDCTSATFLLNGIDILMSLETGMAYDKERQIESCRKIIFNQISNMIENDQFDFACIPELILSLSRVRPIDTNLFKIMGQEFLKNKWNHSIWSITRKMLQGYNKVNYRDIDVFMMINEKLRENDMSNVASNVMAELLFYGANLRALDEDVVDKCLKTIQPNEGFWRRNNFPKDSARICRGLALFQKLTPGILKECSIRCKSVDFDDINDSLVKKEDKEVSLIASYLLSGYEFIKNKHSVSVANSCFPDGLLDKISNAVRRYNMINGSQCPQEIKEICETLNKMGIECSANVLIGRGFYSPDIVLFSKKAVILVENSLWYFVNDPSEPTGRNLFIKQQYKDLKVKAISILNATWSSIEKSKKREFLVSVLKDHGIDVEEFRKDEPQQNKNEEFDLEKWNEQFKSWYEQRISVLDNLKKSKILNLVLKREDIGAVEDLAQKEKKMSKMTKQALIHRIVINEGQNLFGKAVAQSRVS